MVEVVVRWIVLSGTVAKGLTIKEVVAVVRGMPLLGVMPFSHPVEPKTTE